MNIARLRVIAGACGYLMLAFLASVNAGEIDLINPGISIESWLSENGRDIPVLSFEGAFDPAQLDDDIRAENIIRDKDGSTRFQLSHWGPLSRQVFANVRSVAQPDGFTRHIITNIADGRQTEYLSRTSDLPIVSEHDRIRDVGLTVKSEKGGDQETECLTCVMYIVMSILCARGRSDSLQMCLSTCRDQGGIRQFETSACGLIGLCECWARPRDIAIDF
jgi:hypothetical protein